MNLFRAVAVAGVLAAGADASLASSLMKPETVVDHIGQAFGFGDMCTTYDVSTDALMHFLATQDMRIDDRYRRLLIPAREKYNEEASKLGVRASCDRAIRDYGPNGRKVPGLLMLK